MKPDNQIMLRCLASVLHEQVAPFILNGRVRIALGLLALAWLAPATWFASTLAPSSSETTTQFFSSDHPVQRAIDIATTQFDAAQAEAGVMVYYVWGLKDVSREGVNILYDVGFLGEPRFEPGYSFSPRCQQQILSICDDLRLYNTSDEYLELIKRNDALQGGSLSSRSCPLPPTRLSLQLHSLSLFLSASSSRFPFLSRGALPDL